MSAFIEQYGDAQIPPPFSFPGVSIQSFRLDASKSALQALCDKLLNIGSLNDRGFDYRPLFSFVDLDVLFYPRMESTYGPYANMGFQSQNEVYFRLFVLKYVFVAGVLVPTAEVSVFFPFIYTDNSWSVIDGREVVGYPKMLAGFDPVPAPGPYPIQVRTQVFVSFGPNSPASFNPFIQIQSAPVAASPPMALPTWPWGQIDLGVLDVELQMLLQDSPLLLQYDFSTIHLKQFRDAVDPTSACYQALVEGHAKAQNIRNPAFIPSAEVIITPYASLPLISSLGLGGTNLPSNLPYSFTCDLNFEITRILFES